MILITGAGGKTGKKIIRALAGREAICALVHHDEQAATVKALGAERVIVGDLRREDTIRAALQDIRAVYHICPNMSEDETVIGELLLRAARHHHVEHFVYHSVMHPQTEKMNHHWQKLRVEEAIFESGLPFTILQPAPYMQNLLAGWKSIAEEGILRVPYSVDAKFSFIDLEDIERAAKIVLTETGHINAIYELAGTWPMSHAEVAETFSRVLGRNVRAEQEQLMDWKTRAEKSGMNRYVAHNLVRMFEYYDKWGLTGNPNILRWVLKQEPATVESFIQRTLKEHDTVH